ncbi:alanine racemase [Patescibacteria group bacterium]
MVSPYLNPSTEQELKDIINNAHSWVEISKSSLTSNLKVFRDNLPQKTKIMPVVKSNAYGHGLLGAAKAAQEGGCDGLAVISITEALYLRENGISDLSILVLSYPNETTGADLINAAANHNISLSVNSLAAAKYFQEALIGATLKVHLKLDTGTSRVGTLPESFDDLISSIQTLDKLEIEALWTHYSSSESSDQSITDEQFTLLTQANTKYKFPIHAACSASALTHDESKNCDWVRIGIAYYGLWPSSDIKDSSPNIELSPALSWKTKIIAVRKLKAGTHIGYDRTYTLKKDSTIATLGVGYADGYDRALSNKGSVLINGQKAPIRGNICMNLTMVDVTHIDNIDVDDVATLIGTDGNEIITAEDLADLLNTINYEIVTQINWDLPRIYS